MLHCITINYYEYSPHTFIISIGTSFTLQVGRLDFCIRVPTASPEYSGGEGFFVFEETLICNITVYCGSMQFIVQNLKISLSLHSWE